MRSERGWVKGQSSGQGLCLAARLARRISAIVGSRRCGSAPSQAAGPSRGVRNAFAPKFAHPKGVVDARITSRHPRPACPSFAGLAIEAAFQIHADMCVQRVQSSGAPGVMCGRSKERERLR